MSIAVVNHLLLITLIHITPLHCVKIDSNKGVQNLVCATAALHTSMAVEGVMEEKGGVVLPRAHESLWAMMRDLDCHLVVVWIKNDDFVQCQPLLSHFIEDLASKEEKYLTVVVLSFETVSAQNFVCRSIYFREDYIPLAVG